MTLTVRLNEAVEAALDRHCAEAGVTRSAVVQASLSAYLLAQSTSRRKRAAAQVGSPVFEAFRQIGLIGAGELGGVSADKRAVRARAAQRLRRSGG